MNVLLFKDKINNDENDDSVNNNLKTFVSNERKTETNNTETTIDTKIKTFFKNDNTDLIILTTSIFLIYLSLSTGFLTSLLGCQIYRFTHNNIYFRHFILILFIYFAFDITTKYNEFLHPSITFMLSLCIYILFILFSKMTLLHTIFVLFLIVLIAVINKFKRYYNYALSDNEKKLQNSILILNEVENLIIILILFSILIGAGKYYFKKKKEYGNSFNYKTYFFGNVTCKKNINKLKN